MSYEGIAGDLDLGRGYAAQELGQPFDVYRITGASTGQVIHDANKIATKVPVYYKVSKNTDPAIESERRQGIVFYKLIADLSPFRLGDIFVLNDPAYGAGHTIVEGSADFLGFSVASHQPVKHNFGGRLTRTINVYRQTEDVSNSGYHQNHAEPGVQGKPVILSGGVFSLGNESDTPCNIPAGIQGLRPYGDRAMHDIGSMQRKSLWSIFLPPIKNFRFKEGDRIIDSTGARYAVYIPYEEDVGAVGNQLTVEREVG